MNRQATDPDSLLDVVMAIYTSGQATLEQLVRQGDRHEEDGLAIRRLLEVDYHRLTHSSEPY